MSLLREADHVSQNSSTVKFLLRHPPGSSRPTLTAVNIKDKTYLKVAYQPNIFETVLKFNIEESTVKLVIDKHKNEISVTVSKVHPSEIRWTAPTKDEIKAARREAVATESVQEPLRVQEQLKTKDKTKKEAVGQAMEMDKVRGRNVETKIEKAKWKALGSMNLDEDDEEKNPNRIHDLADKAIDEAIRAKKRKEQFLKQVEKADGDSNRAQPIRKGEFEFKMSDRVFPTAARESLLADETEWLAKQASYRERIEIDNPDLRENEKDPVWLKNKGNNLLKTENYRSALHAYDMALKITPKDPNLYLNRALGFMKINNLHKCVDDCQMAIELLTPAVEDNRVQRAKAFTRRGVAFSGLGVFKRAVDDMKHAYDLTKCAKLKADLEVLEGKMIEDDKFEEGRKNEVLTLG